VVDPSLRRWWPRLQPGEARAATYRQAVRLVTPSVWSEGPSL
jgi:hypothetical protein